MKKFILLVLFVLLVPLTYGADVFICSSNAAHGDAAANNGGGYSDTYTDTFADLHTSGGPVDIVAAADITTEGTGDRFTSAGNFTNAKLGMYVYIEVVQSGETDWHEITAVDGSDWIEVAFDFTDAVGDCRVGGLFDHVEDIITAGVVIAGDTIEMVTGTYLLTGNLIIPAGSSSAVPVTVKSIAVNGDDIDPLRTTQSGKATGLLITTDMAIIDCGTNEVIPGAFTHHEKYKVMGTPSTFVFHGTADNVRVYKLVVHNTANTGTLSKGLSIDNNALIANCDLITNSTTMTGNANQTDSTSSVSDCYIKIASTVTTSIGLLNEGSTIDCVFDGSGGSGLRVAVGSPHILSGCTFYNLNIATELILAAAGVLLVKDNLAVDCITFLNNEGGADIAVFSYNNTLVNVTNDYDGDTKGFVGVIGDNDTISAQSAADTFITPGTDFNLKTGSDAIGAATWGNDCGAIQTETVAVLFRQIILIQTAKNDLLLFPEIWAMQADLTEWSFLKHTGL